MLSVKKGFEWCCSFTGSHFDPYDKPLTFNDLKDRIIKNASGIDLLPHTTRFTPTISPRQLSWNKNASPFERWDKLRPKFNLKAVWSRANNYDCLAVPRHSKVSDTLNNANYVKYAKNVTRTIYFQKGRKRSNVFWLINAREAPFVYAILKSSMFKAWCELTANTNGAGDFTIGMWDTFPLPDLTPQRKRNIIKVGRRIGTQQECDDVIDSLFGLPKKIPSSFIFVEIRKKILAEGFLDVFYI